MRSFLQPEELMRNFTRFKLHRAPSNSQSSMPLKNLSPKLFGLFNLESRIIPKMDLVALICLALLLLGTATSLRAQEEPKQDESQQESEAKQDKKQGKKVE